MPRAQRLDDVTCIICMDTLFNQRDELDEVAPIATPDCGHVFHERCLTDWFRSQAQQYIANVREHDTDERGGSPSASDAPALCPNCRKECFADPETGEPIIHRLYINFDQDADAGAASSSVIGSSPPRDFGANRKGESAMRDAEVFRLARRAKGLKAEVEELGTESKEEDVEAMLDRADSLKKDVVSVKAIQGFKTYIGGLTAAVNTFRSQLQDHPLVVTMQERMRKARAEASELKRHNAELVQNVLPSAVEKAIKKEQEETAKQIKKVQKDMELVTRELQKEKVNRQATKKEHEQRMQAHEKQMQVLRRQLQEEQEAHATTRETLMNRNRTLKLYQNKAEGKKQLKEKVEALEAEVDRLKGSASGSTPASSSRRERRDSPSSPWLGADDPDSDAEDRGRDSFAVDDSIQDLGSALFAPDSSPPPRIVSSKRAYPADDYSLEIDMTSVPDRSNTRIMVPDEAGPVAGGSTAAPTTVRSATARTLSSSMFEKDQPKHKPTSSKYFPSGPSRTRDLVVESDPSDDDYDKSLDIEALLRSSQHKSAAPSASQAKRSNPFASNKAESEQRKRLKTLGTASGPSRGGPKTIDLTADSPQRSSGSPLEDGTNKDNISAGPRSAATRSALATGGAGSKGPAKPKSIVEQLGVSDAHGRPTKGVAIGAKVRRRA